MVRFEYRKLRLHCQVLFAMTLLASPNTVPYGLTPPPPDPPIWGEGVPKAYIHINLHSRYIKNKILETPPVIKQNTKAKNNYIKI